METRKNWEDRIDEAERRGLFTKEDQFLAEAFDTCRVGEHTGGAEPVFDCLLWHLGLEFLQAINEQDIQRAREISARIAATDPEHDGPCY